MCSMNCKKLFFISVIGEEDSLNRRYSDIICDLIERKWSLRSDYTIIRHDKSPKEDLYKSLSDAITGKDNDENYEGYLVLLDCLDDSKGICNPNVMFEFGAIKFLNKPFVVIGSHNPTVYPFDVKSINIEPIPDTLINYIQQCHKNNIDTSSGVDLQPLYSNGRNRDNICKFLENVSNKYRTSLNEHSNNCKNITHTDIMEEIVQLRSIIEQNSKTAEYIDGEQKAFIAVKEAVENAKTSLQTSRFANQSIVLTSATIEQRKFMESLYIASKELNSSFHRIICNNSPLKWLDIYNALFLGGNLSKVYIRKSIYSIHFELVIVDKAIAFIHFYQPDHAEGKNQDQYDNKIEKINSTLKIQSNTICQKLSNIFNRLHHKDFDTVSPHDPSRTLLGIPTEDEIKPEHINNGCFFVPENIPEYKQFDCFNNNARHDVILKMFKNAFMNWPISDKDKLDKQNMLVGIALIDKNDNFIREMHKNKHITDDELNSALNIFKQELNKL